MNYYDEEPNVVLEKLQKSPPQEGGVNATGTIDFTLGYKGKCFVIDWQVSSAEKWDWIGIYKSSTEPVDKYLDYQWVVNRTPPYTSSVKVNSGCVACYYRWDSISYKYSIQAKTDPFPDVCVYSETNIPGTRQITNTEFNSLKQVFPKLKLANTIVTGEKANWYNCIAWSIGFDDRWLNPRSNERDFINQYASYGCRKESYSSISAKIDAWSASSKGTHGSRKYSVINLYESKLGQGLRITHGRNDLESVTYGSIFQSFQSPAVFNSAALPVPNSVFTDAEKDKLENMINAVSEETRLRFEELFSKWKSNWFTGDFKYSSNTNDMSQVDGFDELISMGSAIIPLVIGKLIDEENFVALVLYEGLQNNKSEVISYTENDPPYVLLEGEQTRAKRTVKLWLGNQ